MKSVFYALILSFLLIASIVFSAESIRDLFRSSFYAAKNIQSFQLNLKTPRAGEYVLPATVKEMLTLIRTHQLASYKVSEQILKKENILIYQRIVESVWPIRIDPKSNYKFIFINELDDISNCEEKEQGKEVVLVFCH